MSTFPTPTYLSNRLTGNPPPPPSSHLQRASYSSRTLVLDHMLFLQTTTRVRQLEHAVGPADAPAGLTTEVERLGYNRRGGPTGTGQPSSSSSTTSPATSSRLSSLPAHISIAGDGEVEEDRLDEKAAGYERMLSVLLERVKLASGVSTPVPEEDSDEEDDYDDYIVSPPEKEAEDDLLPEGVRLRLALAGIVDVLSRPDDHQPTTSPPLPPPRAEPTPSAAQHRTSLALAPLLHDESTPAVSDRTAALFAAGAQPDAPSADPSSSASTSRSRTPTASGLTSRRSSISVFSTTTGLAPAPERWYDLSEPALGGGGCCGAGAEVGGRWVELLERFILVSAALAEAVGGSTVEEEERRQRARSTSRSARPLTPRGAPAVGADRARGASTTWAAASSSGPAAKSIVPSLAWESDSEGSVDDWPSPDTSADEMTDDVGRSPPPDSKATRRRISNTPVRRRSAALDGSPTASQASAVSRSTPLATTLTTAAAAPGPTVDRSLIARPTRAWFALLSALLVQTVLAGFLDHAWVGLSTARAVLHLGSASSGRAADGEAPAHPPGTGEGLARAKMVLFGTGGSSSRGGRKRRDEFDAVAEANWRELTAVPQDAPSLHQHLLALANARPAKPVEQAVLQYVAAASQFLGTPELARAAPTTDSSPSRRLSLSSLLNPSSPFPTYQQEPPTPPADPARAPRRQGINRWLVPPRLRRDSGGVVVGVKRGRPTNEAGGGDGDDEDDGGRERSARAVEGPGGQGVRPPIIVVEDWPDPYGVP